MSFYPRPHDPLFPCYGILLTSHAIKYQRCSRDQVMLQNVITSAMDWTVTTEQGIEYLENFHYLNAREFLKRVLDKKTDMIWRR